MKQSYRWGTVLALIMFAVISRANAAVIAGEDASIPLTNESTTEKIALSPPIFSDDAAPLNVPGVAHQVQADKQFNLFKRSHLASHSHADSHMSLWLLMLVASLFGLLSEIYHRRPFYR